MLSMMEALWFSIEIDGNLRSHRLYFRPNQLIQLPQISNFDSM